MIAGKDGEVFDLVSACVAAVCAVVVDERAVAEKEEVCIRVEEGTASVTSEAVDMPSVAGCKMESAAFMVSGAGVHERMRVWLDQAYLVRMPFLLLISAGRQSSGLFDRYSMSYLSTAFAWIHRIALIHWRLGVSTRRVHHSHLEERATTLQTRVNGRRACRFVCYRC